MSWRLELSPSAARWLRKADSQVARHMRGVLRALAELDDPRTKGRGLSGSLSGLWRYRIGDHRVIADIRDESVVILVVEIGRRDTIDR